MRFFPVLLLALHAAPLAAQFQLFLVDTISERVAAPVEALGTIGRGDALAVRFRLRNATTAPAPVRLLEVAGSGFSLAAPVALPQTVNPRMALEFGVVFRAATDGIYSAALRSEGVSVLLTATVVPQLTILLETPAGVQPLASGAAIDFGSAERGTSVSRRLRVVNQTPSDQVVPPLEIQEGEFRVSSPSPAGTVLRPLEEAVVELIFTPTATGARRGTLQAGGRRFALTGAGLEPSLPRPRLSLTLERRQNGQQGAAAVLLSEAARTAGSGTLTLEFRPQLPGAKDPSIQLAGGGRTAQFTVRPGDDRGRFGDQQAAPFQTGTTAGALVFTVELGGVVDQQTVDLPAAPVSLAAVDGARTAGGLEVRITGFDNVRTAGPLAFTFFDKAGASVTPGVIRADSSTEFGRYFRSSDAGGLFLLRATFPVTGDASGIDAVEVEIANSAGKVKSPRTAIR